MSEDLDSYLEAILITQALELPEAISFGIICLNKFKEPIQQIDDIITKKVIADPEAYKSVNVYSKYCKYLENEYVDINYCLNLIKEIHIENRSFNFLDLIQILSYFKNKHHRLLTITETSIDCLFEYKDVILPFSLGMSFSSIIVKSSRLKLSEEYLDKIIYIYLYIKNKGPISRRAKDKLKILIEKNKYQEKINNMLNIIDLLEN